MAVDTQYISDKDFNTKFKNYLRDFYTFQFKNKDIDFYDKGNFSKSRMAAVSILSFISGYSTEKLSQLKMQDICLEDDSVSICIDKKEDSKDKKEDSKDEKADSEDVKADSKNKKDGKNKKDSKDKGTITLERPLCEMFRYLYSAEKKAFFLTGNTGTPNAEKLQVEYEFFYKACPSPKTAEKMYRYWGQTYLNEANETISNSTYRNDSIRVQNIVKKMAGVTWEYGVKEDDANGCTEDKDDSSVECITVDTRTLKENPFHSLYQYCNRVTTDKKNKSKDYFVMLYALLIYFHIGEEINYCKNKEPSAFRLEKFDIYLKELAARAFNNKNKDNRPNKDNAWKKWEKLTEKQKVRYASRLPLYFIDESFNKMICEAYNTKHKKNWTWEMIKDSENISDFIYEALACNSEQLSAAYLDVFAYMIINRKTIVYTGEKFEIRTCDCIEKRLLYIALTRFFGCGERQFSNIIKELVKLGILNEKKELIIQGKRGFNLEKNDNREKIAELLSDVKAGSFELEENIGYNTLSLRFDSKIQAEQLKKTEEAISSLGVGVKNSDKLYYCLADSTLKDILGNNVDLTYRFKEMVSFFSQVTPLGETGSFIRTNIPISDKKPETPFYFKHNFIIKALNDYNLIDLLYAVKRKKWIKIECRSPLSEHQYQKFVCFPLEIREDVANGKQLLLYYHPVYRSVSCVRVDFIDSIAVGENKEQMYFFEEDIRRARKLIRYTWGNKFDGFFEGNVKAAIKPSKVKFVVSFDKENEPYIRARLKKELSRGTIEEKEQNENIVHAEIVVYVVNPFDMLHWMRSYTKRIVSIEIEHTGFTDDIMRSYKMYQLPSQESISLKLSENPLEMLESFNDKFTQCDGLHEQLFNEFFNVSCQKLGDILTDILQKRHIDAAFTASKKLEYLDAFILDNSKKTESVRLKREQQVDGFIKNFIVKNESIFTFGNKEGINSIRDLIPLTKTEVQWLINILEHPFAVSFLEEDEIKAIKKSLPEVDLFDINSVVLCNQAVDIKEYYERKGYEGNLRAIINAIRTRKRLDIIGITQYGTPNNHYDFAPAYIEYSKKDNRFRIRGVNGKGEIVTINLERTESIALSGNSFEPDKIRNAVFEADRKKERCLEVIFYDIDNIPEKILSEFSCYRKECVRRGNGKYRMRLHYNIDDCNEIVIRLLAYGSLVTVSADDGGVLAEIKLRLEQQLELSKMINKTTDNVIKEADIEYE